MEKIYNLIIYAKNQTSSMLPTKYNLLVYEDSNHWCNKLSSKIPFMTVEDF